MISTANGLLGVEDSQSYFVCPLQGCSEKLLPEATLQALWLHSAGDSRHRKGPFDQGHFPCELGCEQGFADAAHRLLHHAQMECITDLLPLDDHCTCPGCDWIRPTKQSKKRIDGGDILPHFVNKHGSAAYKQGVELKDEICELGFIDKATMLSHFLGWPSATGNITCFDGDSGHCKKVFASFPGRENIRSIPPPTISKHLQIRGNAQFDPLMCTSNRPHLCPMSGLPPLGINNGIEPTGKLPYAIDVDSCRHCVPGSTFLETLTRMYGLSRTPMSFPTLRPPRALLISPTTSMVHPLSSSHTNARCLDVVGLSDR